MGLLKFYARSSVSSKLLRETYDGDFLACPIQRGAWLLYASGFCVGDPDSIVSRTAFHSRLETIFILRFHSIFYTYNNDDKDNNNEDGEYVNDDDDDKNNNNTIFQLLI